MSSKKSTNVRPSSLRGVRAVMGTLSRFSPGIAAHVAAHLFQRPRRHQRPAREHGWLLDSERVRFTAAGESIVGWTWGEGPTVLLMHGWEGRGSQLGAFVRPLVQLGHKVIAVDGPGHGQSSGSLASPVNFADTIEAVGRLFGPLHAVVAHSFGALGTLYAMQRGLKVERLVLIAPGHPPLTAARHASEMIGASDEVLDRMVDLLGQQTGVPIGEVQAAMTRFAPEVPTLVVHDEEDEVISMENARGISERLPNGELHVTVGLGHRRILREPAVVRLAAAFVAGVGVEMVGWGNAWQEMMERESFGLGE
jgi:pimeloyl-ACP methyl ester carboxylesterase